MNRATLFILLPAALLLGACMDKTKTTETSSDWHPQNASVARHITTVHGFKISEEEGSHLRVTKTDGKVVATFREDALEILGGDKALFVFGMSENSESISKSDYLYFLEALHAYLVMNAPRWDGGENGNRKAIAETTVENETKVSPTKEKERPRNFVEISSETDATP